MTRRIRTRAGLIGAAVLALGLAAAPAFATDYPGSEDWGQGPAIDQQEPGPAYARPAGWDNGPRDRWDRGDWDRDRGHGWGRPGWGYPRYAESWRPHRGGPPCRVEMERVWTGWGWRDRPVRRCW